MRLLYFKHSYECPSSHTLIRSSSSSSSNSLHLMTSPPPSSTSSSSSTAPLLLPLHDSASSPARQAALAALLGRLTGRRGGGGGGASVVVRETAARELEERRADWGYSKPVVALDMMWNSAFIVVSIVMVGCSMEERTNVPIRVWVVGYALQCLLHVVLVWVEYRRRTWRRREEERLGVADSGLDNVSSMAKRCESINTMISFIWWIVGFYWVISGGEILLQGAPRLYWLAVVFLAFDVFFAIFCVVLACLIGVALCCCLPCIIAVLYAVTGQVGASEADLSILVKYRFEIPKDEEKPSVGAGKMVPLETRSGYLATERVLLPEDAECCICLGGYEDGIELHALPCSHHFHSTCIVKWLKMNATCPLCKYNILKGSEQV